MVTPINNHHFWWLSKKSPILMVESVRALRCPLRTVADALAATLEGQAEIG